MILYLGKVKNLLPSIIVTDDSVGLKRINIVLTPTKLLVDDKSFRIIQFVEGPQITWQGVISIDLNYDIDVFQHSFPNS